MTGDTINRFVADAAQRWPDAQAARYAGHGITYAQLATQCARLASVLREQGVRKGTPVAVCLERCLEAMVALHAIQWAGGVAVALDPDAPPDRHLRIVATAGITHIIGHDRTAERISALVQAGAGLTFALGVGPMETAPHVTTVAWHQIDTAPLAALETVQPQDRAYVVFTSGSTGVPKGIVHSHASAAAFAHNTARLYDLGPGHRIANHAPTHFDIAFFGLYSGISAGATTVFVSKAQTLLLPGLAAMVQSEAITHWYSLTSVAQNLFALAAAQSLDLPALRLCLFGGDGITNAQLRALMQAYPQVRFSHSYGPAEVNQCSYYDFAALPPDDTRHPIIGHMLPGSQALILDDDEHPVDPGQIGTLWVNSSQAMIGYLGNPDLNARVFRDLPGEGGHVARFYCTGDQFHRDADGLLHFHGRKDRLIKFRGVRVELDEVEAILNAHPEIAESSVFLDDSGKRMFAAVILRDGSALTRDAINEFASAHLPKHSVPTDISLHTDFPRTGSMKTDRGALLALLVATPAQHDKGPSA